MVPVTHEVDIIKNDILKNDRELFNILLFDHTTIDNFWATDNDAKHGEEFQVNDEKFIESEFKCKVNLYDARTANIWAKQ